MRRILPAILALPLIIAAGLAYGRMTDRWADSRASAVAVEKVARLPMTIGSWQGQAQDLDRAVIEQAGIAGYAARRYVDASTGAAVTLLLVCGRPGPIAAHSPEVCYPGAGYEPRGEARQRTVPIGPAGGPAADFLVRDFARPAAPGSSAIQVAWSWKGGAAWEVSQSPRISFARYPNLYKLYVVTERSPTTGDDPARGFLEALLPALQSVLS